MNKAKQKFKIVLTRNKDEESHYTWTCCIENKPPLCESTGFDILHVEGNGTSPVLAITDMFELYGKRIWQFYECGDE